MRCLLLAALIFVGCGPDQAYPYREGEVLVMKLDGQKVMFNGYVMGNSDVLWVYVPTELNGYRLQMVRAFMVEKEKK